MLPSSGDLSPKSCHSTRPQFPHGCRPWPGALPYTSFAATHSRLKLLHSNVFTTAAPGANGPPDRRVKNKNAVQVRIPTQRMERRDWQAGRKAAKTNLPLREALICRIITLAVRVGRCVGGSDTCTGLRVLPTPASCRIFVFHVDYNRNVPSLQAPFPQHDKERRTSKRRPPS